MTSDTICFFREIKPNLIVTTITDLDASKFRSYLPLLVRFMSFRDRIQYPPDTNFSRKQPLSILPEQLVRFLNTMAYRKKVPGEMTTQSSWDQTPCITTKNRSRTFFQEVWIKWSINLKSTKFIDKRQLPKCVVHYKFMKSFSSWSYFARVTISYYSEAKAWSSDNLSL